MNFSDFADDVARSVGFLSRIPVPSRFFTGHDGSLSRTVQAFPVAGLIISLPAALLLATLMAGGADPLLSALLTLALQTYLTGALHDDGLADCADGLGGGRDRARALEIMKDSRIGSYGAVSLVLSFAIRGAALATLAEVASPGAAFAAFLAVGALSRAALVWHWSLLAPARSDGVAASAGTPERSAVRVACISGGMIGLVLMLVALETVATLFTLALVVGAAWFFSRHVERRIGGQTGDTIGATQQLTEIMSLVALALFA